MDEKISQILVRGLLVAGLIFQVDQTLVDTRQEPSSPSLTKKKGEPFTFNTDEHEDDPSDRDKEGQKNEGKGNFSNTALSPCTANEKYQPAYGNALAALVALCRQAGHEPRVETDDDEESDSDFSESETMSDLTVDLRVLTSRAMRTFPRPPGQYDVAGPPAEATEFCRRSLYMYERFEQLKCGISSCSDRAYADQIIRTQPHKGVNRVNDLLFAEFALWAFGRFRPGGIPRAPGSFQFMDTLTLPAGQRVPQWNGANVIPGVHRSWHFVGSSYNHLTSLG
ncbi:hypothetical protein B0H13DRAFT_1873180 [Mycena leptocephala]|nr:hypothetical protein B0H13DRAFT_1873180 [Mycena leptocephala]